MTSISISLLYSFIIGLLPIIRTVDKWSVEAEISAFILLSQPHY